MRTGRRKRLHFSNFYSFRCGKASVLSDDHSQIGGPGFSRVVFCNEPDSFESGIKEYAGNYVSTTKYTAATFLPKSLFEQFRRVANFYFLVTGILAFTPLAPYTALSAILPLVLVIGATMVKEGIEDWRRKQQDVEVNSRKVKVHQGDGVFNLTEWQHLKVGDIVKVEKDQFFPADLLLLSSCFDDAICYVETMNLDGETNLKLKQALEVTSSLHEDANFKDFKALVKCEDPNANLYTFVGSMEYEEQQNPLSPQQLLLRGSKLRNTEYIYGAVIFTGHDTKVMQNATDPPSKRSKIERKMDRIIYFLFAVLFTIAFVGSVYFGIVTEKDLDDGHNRWYLQPEDSDIFFDPRRAPAAAMFHFLTAVMLYSYLIPISLYVSIEIVKVLQSIFINKDINMYYEETDKPAHARTSNLTEELGQVDTILSDKTGTLTCNSMEFVKCSVAGTAYGRGITEVEKAMAKRNGSPLMAKNKDHGEDGVIPRKSTVKGFNFEDERIMNASWLFEPHSDVIQKFFRLLAVCHTVIPEVDEVTGKVSYEAESPDEAAFVIAAREVGFEFFKRTQTNVSVHELDLESGKRIERSYKILNVLEFNSTRKRMSVIVKDEDGKILLLSKGADSIMFERLGKSGRRFEQETREHVNEYADAGLRTLILAYRELSEEEYNTFNEKFLEAKNSVSEDRESIIDAVTDKIEKDLILLGATAVEDKLQPGVPDCIDKLAQAGIKIWVLTGDKMETAINIGYACSLLRQGMKQIIITLESPDIIAVEKAGEKNAIARASKGSVSRQITEGKALLTASSTEAFALIIDGKSLTYALDDEVKDMFLDLAIRCASVICCRSSPKQKALVTRLVKNGTGKITLAVGDGANDVGMLQEADIGVGISGVEGMQAVMSSDVAIAQFRFLERLLLVHGHWCYRRISTMICYFFYKNILFGVTVFLYEAYTSFSGQPAYNEWFLSSYNVFFTSLPVIALGVFDQDVSARLCLKFPLLYQEGIQNLLFRWRRIIGWMINGVCSAVIIFFFCITALDPQAFKKDGKVAEFAVVGATMYTCVVWVANCQMALAISYFTLIQHIVIWGGIALWYIFLLIYGTMSTTFSTTAYKIFVEALAPSPFYWIITILTVISALIPYFAYNAMASLLLLTLFLCFTFTAIPFFSPVSAEPEAKTYIFRVDSFSKPAVFPTHYHWYSSEFTEPVNILHVYDNVFHGFSASLSPSQAASVLQHPSILATFEDRRRQLHTTRSPQFLGLRNQKGLWSESDYGSDVIVGVLDTGIWPERRSFSDLNLGPVPTRWKGVCETGAKFTSRNCNRKIIGARFFSKGHEAAPGFGPIGGGINDTVEFRSPRDADGHGTHTASTAAGRHAFRASMSGYASGIAKGVAPKARLAVYKVCWKNSGCFDSDILAAFDAAVSDGVDVISISIGGGDGISSPYYLDPIAIGAYGAVARGVFVSSSAGNDGPNGMSVTNLAPWLTTVGAGTIDRNFPAEVILGDGRKLSGVSLYAGKPLNGKMYSIVYPGKSGVLSASLCMENSLDPHLVRGKIVICDRGSNPRVAKGLVVSKAGGVGMILTNGVSNGEGLVGDAHMIPTCAVGANEGDAIKAYISKNPTAAATINFHGTIIGVKPAPVVASFSGRGPNGLNPEILKPDIIAPGVNILAAWTDAVGPTGLDLDHRKAEFNILSGTSMACPHVSGAAALLKSAHPDWSPAAIRSAMMTTANLVDNRLLPMTDEATGKPATPYDYGAGHLNLDLALDPGLVYDLANQDYVSFLCAIEYGPKTIQVITKSPVNCPMRKPLPENLNYPSIAALFSTATKGVSSKTFFRTVTNVGDANAVYRVKIEAPKGVTVSVKPAKLGFSEKIRKLSYYVTITVDSKNLVLNDSGAVFGSLSWVDGKHVVRSPIVVTQMSPL